MRSPRRLGATVALSISVLVASAALTALAASPAHAAVTDVKINEIESDGTPDWIEIVNTGATTVDVGNLYLMDEQPRTQQIPAGTMLAAGAVLAVDTTFGLGSSDTARLFQADGVTQLDSFTLPDHAVTTWGRCPGVGGFVNTVVATKGTANSCQPVASPWPGGPSVSTVDVAGFFGEDVSGLAYDGSGSSTRGVLWATRNGDGRLFRLLWNGTQWVPDTANGWSTGKAMGYTAGGPVGGLPDAEGLTVTDSGSAGGVYSATERNDTPGNDNTSRMSVLRYDVSGAAASLVATDEWNLTGMLPAVDSNEGLEAVTWVPDSYLVGTGFVDANTAAPYAPATYPGHGAGLFLVGVEGTGSVYAFALTPGGTATRVATFASGMASVMDLQFEKETQQLWVVCDNNCNGQIGRFAVSGGVFAPVGYVARPTGMPNYNNEGFLIAPQSECAGGSKPVYWADDSNDANHVLREGSIACTAPVTSPPVTNPPVTGPPATNPPVTQPKNCSVQLAAATGASVKVKKATKALKKAKKIRSATKAKAVKRAKSKLKKAKKSLTTANTALASCGRG